MIPHIIHQFWVGPPEPDQITAWRQTVIDQHPDWEYRYWTEPPELRNRHIYDAAESLHPLNPWQFRADVARYEILHQHGGVWVDCDFEFRAPLDPYMDSPFVGWAVDGRVVNNALMGFTAGHPALDQIIRRLPRNIAMYRVDATTTQKVGPKFITPIIHRYRDIKVYPEAEFYPLRWDERERVEFPDAPFVHHYTNKRHALYDIPA